MWLKMYHEALEVTLVYLSDTNHNLNAMKKDMFHTILTKSNKLTFEYKMVL